MGITYWGPFADAIGGDAHEGYANRKMREGRWSNGTWSAEFPADGHVGFRADCACGWHGDELFPPTDEGEQAAYEAWGELHLDGLIEAEARKHQIRADRVLQWMKNARRDNVKIKPDPTALGGERLTEWSVGFVAALELLGKFVESQPPEPHHGTGSSGGAGVKQWR